MLRPTALTLLAVMAAAPASAQTVGRGDCQPHRNGEVRCAVRVDIPGGNRPYSVFITATRAGNAEARIVADTYISTCGTAGQLIGRSNIANSGTSHVAGFTNERSQAGAVTQGVLGFCVETFLTACSSNGQAANCQQVLNLGATKIEVR